MTTLEDLRVLDLSNGTAGAYCTKLFADFGADVIAIEPPAGNPLRRQGSFAGGAPNRETGAAWLYLATNKRSVTLDVTTATGRRLFRRMAEQANVIVESFAPGTMDGLGLGFRDLHGIKRRIVLTSITPFGQTGPRANWKATNMTSFASGGQMSLTGDPDREPLVNGGSQAEYQAGLHAFAASATAAHNADSYEVPQHIDISLQECMASALELYLPWWAYLKRDIARRRGNVMSAVVGAFPAKEGHVGIHVMPRNWPAFADAIGRKELADDPRFRTAFDRLQNNDELEAIVYEWAGSKTARELYEECGPRRAPISFANTLADLLDSPQLNARGYFQQVDHPEAGEQTYPGAPFSMSTVEASTGRAPLLGEHNTEVYGEQMGLAKDRLVRLRAAGVI
jgi:crotonobetainyl-CoA:carnitine CoA-transferase CaiB-like acyl-CoA transferase